MIDTAQDDAALTAEEQDRQELEDLTAMWLRKARNCFRQSTDYMNSEVRSNWERDIAHFQNRHPPGSKFNTAAYKNRSKVFRPKTRLAARANEAAVAAAMFSTNDLLDMRAENENDPASAAAAAAQKSLLQYRLENTIPWFLTVVGAWQDCYVYGICATYQCWKFDERVTDVELTGNDGQPMLDAMQQPVISQRRETVMDKPWVGMIPPENIRFDSGCDWRDPVGSSPFLIRIVPMYVDDVMLKMEKGEWRYLPRDTVRAAGNAAQNDSVKRARDAGRPQEANGSSENPLVHCHENFIREGGVEIVYWTLGTEHLLADPMELKDVYIIGERPIVIGRVIVETHRAYPSSQAGLSSGLQEATNEVSNQRFDNVALVLNKRYAIKRGKQIDFDALMRNVPGGGIVMDDPVGDLRVIETEDVTASSYNEQDRFDNQFDEMQGTFSASAVQSNRSIGETVGGITLASGAASAVGEYGIRVFAETWVEPVLRQLSKYISAYETDATVLAVAGQNAKLTRFGQDRITDEMLLANTTLRVNVGIGSTNPQQKVDRVMLGVKTIASLEGVPARLNNDEIIKEVMGSLGFKDGERFVMPKGDPPPTPTDPMVDVKMKELELRGQELQFKREQMQIDAQAREQDAERKGQMWLAELDLKRELGLTAIASRENMTVQQLSANVGIAALRDKTLRETKAIEANNTMDELDLKRSTGSGI